MKYSIFATALLLLFSVSNIAFAQTMPNPNRPNSYVANEGWEASISGFNFLQLDSNGYLYVDCIGCSGGGGGGGGAITAAANSFADGWSSDFGTLASAAYNGSNTASLLAIEKANYNQLLLLSTSANQSTEIGYLSTLATNSGTQALASKQATINADGGSQVHIQNSSIGVTQYQSPWVTSVTIGGTAVTLSNPFLNAIVQAGAQVGSANPLYVQIPNGVVLNAGSSLIGKFGIDQTTPGTTNAVVANPPLINSGTPSQVNGTCGTSSGTILAASTVTTSVSFHLPLTAANAVYLNFAGGTATTASPSWDLQPGQTLTFTAAQGLLPTSAVTCIATASTSVVELYK